MKKIIALLMALSMLCLFASCGGNDTEETTVPGQTSANGEVVSGEGSEDDATVSTEQYIAAGEWTNKTGAFLLGIVGAELFDDEDGVKAIRVYLDFTDKEGSYTTTYADEKLDVVLVQNETELDKTSAVYGEDVAEYGNNILNIRPGTTIRVIEEYALASETDTVKFTFTAPNQDKDILTYDFDVTALPGAPEKALEIKTIDAPAFTEGWAESGKCSDYYDDEIQHEVAIKNAEFVEGSKGEKLIRVYFDFTNNSDEATDMLKACEVRLFQDGIQLKEGQAKEVIDEERAIYDDSESGVQVSVANSYILISDSPVEVEIYDTWNDSGLAKVFPVN